MNIVKGHYRVNGGLLERGHMLVEPCEGGWQHCLTGARLQAQSYCITGALMGVEITSPDAAFEFLPDAGELQRIGMEVSP